jgi:hypothetical protein
VPLDLSLPDFRSSVEILVRRSSVRSSFFFRRRRLCSGLCLLVSFSSVLGLWHRDLRQESPHRQGFPVPPVDVTWSPLALGFFLSPCLVSPVRFGFQLRALVAQQRVRLLR